MNRQILLKTILPISSLFIILSFFAGWMFIKTYFGNFGISQNTLDFATEQYFISSFYIITNMQFLIPLLSLVLYVSVTHSNQAYQYKLKATIIFFDIVFILLLFIFTFFLSISEGNKLALKNRLSTTTKLSSVEIETTKQNNLPKNLKILHMGKDKYIFIQALNKPNENLNTFILGIDKVEYLKVIKE